ncbi:MAG: glycoside hydrolase family 16 protein, partial [Gammaproteobacteria bacterium]|nr:glycoside hydrolase family 16 protein [Gammaproteobacteria bacterium]
MYGQERSSPYGYSTWEMEVYGVVPLIADSDSDGVDDSIDQCPGTETDTPVQSDGCEYGVYGGYESPTSYPGYDLVWSDEFDGNALNLADWTHEIGDGCNIGLCGWGNNENQYYKAENTVVSNGVLVIEARLEDAGNRNYTSSRIKTQGKQSFQYGRIDIRAVLPSGNGPWPALWMLGESISSVGWPRCGEVDIMEKRGGDEDTLLGTAHWYAENVPVNASYGGETDLPSGTFADEFHVFSIVWDATRIRWYLDDSPTPYHVISITPASLSE